MIWFVWLDFWSFVAGVAWCGVAIALPLGLSAWRLRKRLEAQIRLSIRLGNELALHEPPVLVLPPTDDAA